MAANTSGKKTLAWGLSPKPLMLQRMQMKRGHGIKVARIVVQVAKDRKKRHDGNPPSPVRIVHHENRVDIQLAPFLITEIENDPRLKSNKSVMIRDAVGNTVGLFENLGIGWAEYDFQLSTDDLQAALTGLELALYRFKAVFRGELPKVGISLTNHGRVLEQKFLTTVLHRAVAVNLARHLVNLPPNILNPVTYAQWARDWFGGQKNVSVEVWDERRLAREKMNLHLAVGQGSQTPPRFVRISYRPSSVIRSVKGPIALIGKGVTFDSGGLDIKPSAGMRLMKKDMGGSAAVAAVAHWAVRSQIKTALDVYLPLAENAISGMSFRPSDVLVARGGQSIEIHNTDAEGRLLLADAIDVAATQREKPRLMIDVATLTGAIKVALGAGLAGLFATDTRLAHALARAGQQTGDLTWTMPLFQKYRAQTNSNFADMVNAVDGFGGAVTAALFLEKFTHGIPWAHLDIYAWKDAAEGAWREAGGSGQSVLGLCQWLENLPASTGARSYSQK